MKAWIATAAVALVTMLAVACGGGGESQLTAQDCLTKAPTNPVAADASVEEVVDRIAIAITCPGHAFHMRSAGEYETETYGFRVESDTWVDIENNVARTQSVLRPASGEALLEAEEAGLEDPERRDTVIIHADARYTSTELIGYPDDENQDPVARRGPPDCHGPGREALGSLILCEGPLSDWETTVELHVSFRGRAAIALLTVGESSDADGTSEITSWLYFDAVTLLPLGRVDESTSISGGVSLDADTTYENEFVALDSLPADFFDPASIGYVETDKEAQLDDAEIEVYWLGREFEASENYPALALDHVFARARSHSGEGGFVVEMTYRSAEDEFGRIWVRIWLYPPEAWEFREQHTPPNACKEIADVELAGARALVIRKYHELTRSDSECPPHDRFAAEVHFEDTIVEIDAPSTIGGRETFRSPYDSEEAMELLVRSLEQRE